MSQVERQRDEDEIIKGKYFVKRSKIMPSLPASSRAEREIKGG